MKRSPRDMAWILLLAAVAFMGIRALSEKIRTAQAIDGADPIALIIEPGIWRVLNNFASGSVCLVLASHFFAEDDYIRCYDEFLLSKGITTTTHQ